MMKLWHHHHLQDLVQLQMEQLGRLALDHSDNDSGKKMVMDDI